MQTILTVSHLFLAIGLIGLVLMQHGRGADAGAAFGSGASGTVFGARGAGSFLSRATAIIAALFFVTSMALAYFAAQIGEPQGLMDGVEVPAPMGSDSALTPETGAPLVPTGAEVQQGIPVVPMPAGDGGATDVPMVPSAPMPVETVIEVDVPAAAPPQDQVPVTEQPEPPMLEQPSQPAGD